jgi:hypothetical protein
MMDAQRVVAAVMAALCLVFLLRLLVGAHWRARADRWWWRVLQACQAPWQQVKRWLMRRQVACSAAEQTRELIARARRTRVERRGNVYSPRAFNERRQRGQSKDETRGQDRH